LVNLLQSILEHDCEIFTPRVQSKNKYVFFLGISCGWLRQFIGKLNYFRDMWFHKTDLPAIFHWLSSHQARSRLNGAHPINRPLIQLRNLLGLRYFSVHCYPDYNKPFHHYLDASYHQLGIFIMQNEKQNVYGLSFAKSLYRSKRVCNKW
jgi:hypothetical protein